MKSILILITAGIFLLTGLGANALAVQSEPTDPPHAEFPETAYQFDKIIDGTLVTHAFKVKNTGKGVLEITKVKTG